VTRPTPDTTPAPGRHDRADAPPATTPAAGRHHRADAPPDTTPAVGRHYRADATREIIARTRRHSSADLRSAVCSLLLALLAGCAAQPIRGTHGQLVVVAVSHWDATEGTLTTWERHDGRWSPAGIETPVTIGRNGAAWGLGLHPPQQDGPQKREGDGRAPAGLFALGTAFGYAPALDTALGYAPMHATHWCMDVPASPHYNRIVDAQALGADAVAGSSEPMRLDLHAAGDQRYRAGFVIRHNAGAVPGAGSCIFAHLWKAPGVPTAGCTAMPAEAMDRLLAWLDAGAAPLFALLPDDAYARVQADWNLPPIRRTPDARDR
jgi:L,D-peptidoglycan transpeptidase YkuD (ErfK/YbiS/YcfS/YnhG family)